MRIILTRDREIYATENGEIMRSIKLVLAMACVVGFLHSCVAPYNCGTGGSIPQYQTGQEVQKSDLQR
ncbi:MAG: hypothetical protein A4E58_02959 [Syntrophorhabdus sp. PtaB.Bin006]|nr:MAG: hypothetical protein A4E58_02959 [Syntrophorhabdus sp. PtaB.Bin006]